MHVIRYFQLIGTKCSIRGLEGLVDTIAKYNIPNSIYLYKC